MRKMLGGAGHSSSEGGEVGGDAVDMEVNKGLLTFFAEEEGAVLVVVHEEIFGEDGGAGGVVVAWFSVPSTTSELNDWYISAGCEKIILE